MKTYLSMRNSNKNIKFYQFPQHLWWQNKGLVVLNFRVYHDYDGKAGSTFIQGLTC